MKVEKILKHLTALTIKHCLALFIALWLFTPRTTVASFCLRLEHMYSFIAYCLLLHMKVFMLGHCCYANKRIELN